MTDTALETPQPDASTLVYGEAVEGWIRTQIKWIEYMWVSDQRYNHCGREVAFPRFLREFRTVGVSFPRQTGRTTRAIKIAAEFREMLYVSGHTAEHAQNIYRGAAQEWLRTDKDRFLSIRQLLAIREWSGPKINCVVLDEVELDSQMMIELYERLGKMCDKPNTSIVIRIN